MARWRVAGEFLKLCNCPTICSCDTSGAVAPQGSCESVLVMRIRMGHFEAVVLDGLTWSAVIRWPGTFYDGNGTMELYVDETASSEQRRCLEQILGGNVGGPFFEVLNAVTTTTHGPYFLPIKLEFDRAKRRARIVIPNRVEATVEPLTFPLTGEEQRVIVRFPGSLAYREIEVAKCRTLRTTGVLEFEWRNTHSALATIDHTDEGLVD